MEYIVKAFATGAIWGSVITVFYFIPSAERRIQIFTMGPVIFILACVSTFIVWRN